MVYHKISILEKDIKVYVVQYFVYKYVHLKHKSQVNKLLEANKHYYHLIVWPFPP